MEAEVFKRAQAKYFEEIKKLQERREQIEQVTRDQSNSVMVQEIKKKLLTSSNFRLNYKRKKEDCSKLVKSLENINSIGNQGNFLELIKLVSIYNPTLTSQMQTNAIKKIQKWMRWISYNKRLTSCLEY